MSNTKKTRFIDALLTGDTVSQAAGKAGVTERTAYTWHTSQDVRYQLHQAQAQALNLAGLRLVALCDQALTGLQDVMNEPTARGANTKRLACVSVLELALKWRELVDFEERLSEVERRLNDDTKGKAGKGSQTIRPKHR